MKLTYKTCKKRNTFSDAYLKDLIAATIGKKKTSDWYLVAMDDMFFIHKAYYMQNDVAAGVGIT